MSAGDIGQMPAPPEPTYTLHYDDADGGGAVWTGGTGITPHGWRVDVYTLQQLEQHGVNCRLQALRLAAKECADAAASAGALERGLHAMGETAAAKLEMAYRMAAEHCEQAILVLIDGEATSSAPDTSTR